MKRQMLGLALLAGMLLGCGGPEPAPAPKPAPGEKKSTAKHEGWWCPEHGVPEYQCSMCDDKVAKSCKDLGDWCEKHERAKSHCFICNPKLKDKFAAIYRAKYDKDPPPTEE
ncbi:MAG: RND transporter [Gemmataceae bacterium]|nr:RND transporter [Gemmataceae bacterium]